MMKPALALLTVSALVLSAPLLGLAQSTTPQVKTMVVEGIVTNVDASCANNAAAPAGCQAVVEVTPSASSSQTGSSPSTSTSSTSTSSTSTSSTSTTMQATKVTIPKNLKIVRQAGENNASPTQAPPAIIKGNVVRITYEQRSDGNLATQVVILKGNA